nr:hypothetical protein [Tanacetum cinerariifolium]
MDIFAFIHTPDPTKVKIVERERNEGEPLLLETTIGRTVLLLPVAPDRAESELDASVERLFDEGGSGNQTEQGDFTGGGKDADIQPVIEAADTVVEDVAHVQPKRQGKRKSVNCGCGSALERLLAGAVLNAKVKVAAMPTLPFMTASISSTLEREGGDHTDSAGGLNLCAIGAPPRFVISLDSSHHSGTNVAEAKVDSLVTYFVPIMTTITTITSTVDPALVAKKKLVKRSPFFADSSSAGGTDPTTSVFSDLTGSDLLVGAIRTVIEPDTDLQKVYVSQLSVTNGSRLDNGRVCPEMVDEFAPLKFFAYVRGMKHDQLFTEFNVGVAHQMSLSVEVRMRAEYNVKEKRRLKSVAERQVELLKVREREIENLKAHLLLSEAEAAEAIRLRAQASNFEVVEKSLRDERNALKERNAILEKERNGLDVKVTKLEASVVGKERELTDLNALITSVISQNDILVDRYMKVVNDKFGKLYTDFVEMALFLEEKFYPHLLTTVCGRMWLLTHRMKLAIVKSLNSPEYLSALGAAIGKATEKGMQDGLSAGIVHSKEGRVLTDVAAYNPSAKVDYTFALQQLRNVNFFLPAELKSNKDVSVETVMDILRLEDPLAEKQGLNELQPNVDQLMVLIHRSPDKVVLGATALSALRDVFVPLAEPFSTAVLKGTEGTFDTPPATANTNMALSTTFASAISIALISVDDYEVVGTEDQAVADENAASFLNVDDAELNISQ